MILQELLVHTTAQHDLKLFMPKKLNLIHYILSNYIGNHNSDSPSTKIDVSYSLCPAYLNV